MHQPVRLKLVEYEPVFVSADKISQADAERIWRQFGSQVAIDFPSPKTQNRWKLVSQGWIGHIPVSRSLSLDLWPKVDVNTLWEMLAYAYDFPIQTFTADIIEVRTWPAFYNRLAQELAERTLHRIRQGIARSYIPRRAPSSAVRGRIDFGAMSVRPDQTDLTCTYDEHTADIPHNTIIAYTLTKIAATNICTPELLQLLRRANQRLPQAKRHMTVAILDQLQYDRLTADYRPLHALCRLFLDAVGPTQEEADIESIPFLLNMGQLYERFVAAWLHKHLPKPYRVQAQERIKLSTQEARSSFIDMVVYDGDNKPIIVLDTKYKIPDMPAAADIYQITFYAHERHCQRAFLVYPNQLRNPTQGINRDVAYGCITFALDRPITQAGPAFLKQLDLHP